MELSFVGEVNDHREERAMTKKYFSHAFLTALQTSNTKTQMTLDLYQIRKISQGKTVQILIQF